MSDMTYTQKRRLREIETAYLIVSTACWTQAELQELKRKANEARREVREEL